MVDTPATSAAHTIVVGTTAPPASLDFTTTSGAAIPQALMGNVYEGLVRIDQDSTIQPLLATSWELDDAGTTYTFHLREGREVLQWGRVHRGHRQVFHRPGGGLEQWAESQHVPWWTTPKWSTSTPSRSC